MKYNEYISKITERLMDEIWGLRLKQDQITDDLQDAWDCNSFMQSMNTILFHYRNPEYVSGECQRFICYCKMLQAPASFVESFKHRTALEIGDEWQSKLQKDEK